MPVSFVAARAQDCVGLGVRAGPNGGSEAGDGHEFVVRVCSALGELGTVVEEGDHVHWSDGAIAKSSANDDKDSCRIGSGSWWRQYNDIRLAYMSWDPRPRLRSWRSHEEEPLWSSYRTGKTSMSMKHGLPEKSVYLLQLNPRPSFYPRPSLHGLPSPRSELQCRID